MNYYLTSDYLFKAMFGRDEERSKLLLMDFLNAILERKGDNRIINLMLKNPYSIRKSEFEKESIFDIKVQLSSGELIDLEMQIDTNSVYRKRSLFYWSRLYGSQEIKGQDYSKLCKCICINIVDSSCIYERDDMHSVFGCVELEHHYPLTKDMEIHYFQLDRLYDTMESEESERDLWLSFIKNVGHPDKYNLIETIVESKEVISMAFEEYKHLTSDELIRERYEAHEKYLMDKATQISVAKESGIQLGREEGLKEGIKEEKIHIAKRMLELGLDDSVIEETTGLNKEALSKLT